MKHLQTNQPHSTARTLECKIKAGNPAIVLRAITRFHHLPEWWLIRRVMVTSHSMQLTQFSNTQASPLQIL
jgi:hypothetical protein